MSLTVTSFTDKILEYYPRAFSIKVQVYEASMDTKFKSWTGRIKSVKISTRFRDYWLNKQEYLDIFGNNYTIKLGANNSKRYIRRNTINNVYIDTEANTFINEDGVLIRYYPTESD